MDEEYSQKTIKTRSQRLRQQKAIKKSEDISYDKDNNQKQQCHKNCSFKRIRKNAKYEEIQIIQTIGKRNQYVNDEVRCKFKPISFKKLQLKMKSLQDYASSFFETTFEKTFLKRLKTQDFSNQKGESSEIIQTQIQNTSAILGNQTEQGRKIQCFKIEFKEKKRRTSSSGQYQEPNIHQIVQQQIIDLNDLTCYYNEKQDQSFITRNKTKVYMSEMQQKRYIENDEGILAQAKNLEKKTEYDQLLIVKSMFDYLEKIKQNFQNQFSFGEIINNIQDQDKQNSILNKEIVNHQQDLSQSIDYILPPIQLKQGYLQKYKDCVIKIFNSFILRGRERKQSGSTPQQNTDQAEEVFYSDVVSKKQPSKKKQRNSLNSSNISEIEAEVEEEEEEEEEFDLEAGYEDFNENHRYKINYQNENNNQISTNKQKQSQTKLKKSIIKDQAIFDELDIQSNELNKSSLPTLTSIAKSQKMGVNLSSNQINEKPEGGQVITEFLIKQGSHVNQINQQSQNEEQKNEKSQKLQEKSRKNSISSPQQQSNSQQSQYHNLKNSFMHLVIQIFTREVLNCFDIPGQYLDYSAEVLERMKNYSFKYRPVKGRYQYYSNIHYSTLFLKLNKNTLGEIQSCAHYIQYHKVFFKEDLSNSQTENDFEVIKCNFYKMLIGQIVLFTLFQAEEILLNEINLKNNQNFLDSSRFNYISKVKKGIQKLQRAKHAIRF